jgi:hypothetical protein
MSTINDKSLIEKIIQNNGHFEDDPRVWCIVEFINGWGSIAYGVTWENESPNRRGRYMIHNPPYINNPKVIWSQEYGANIR